MTETYNNMDEFWKHYDVRKKHKLIMIKWFYLYKILEKAKLIYSGKKQISDCLGMGPGVDWEVDDGNGFVLITVVVTWLYTFVKTHLTAHLSWVHFIICKLCLNKVDLF